MDLPDLFAPGDVIAGRYRVERVIGQGGMGVVVQVMHLQLEQRFAIKFLLGHATYESTQAARFFREARAAAQIKSEHVTRVVDTGTLDSGAPYIVMECLEGRDLASELEARSSLPVSEAVDYVLQACEAIAEAHAMGIVHRDLKPANLFLSRRSDGSICVKVLDFGISKVTSSTSNESALTATSAMMGSPVYMSPEQIRSSKDVDARSDVWSLGVILYELLSGRTPFQAETVSAMLAQIVADPPAPLAQVSPAVPPPLAAAVSACLEKDLARRMRSVTALAESLVAFAPPSARVSVERILRLDRGRASSVPAIAGTEVMGTAGPPTGTAWGQTADGSGPSRRGLRFVLAAGAVLAVLVIAGAIFLRPATPVAEEPVPASSPGIAELAPAKASEVASPPPVPSASAAATAAASAEPVTATTRKPSSAAPAASARAAVPATRPASRPASTPAPVGGGAPPFGGRL